MNISHLNIYAIVMEPGGLNRLIWNNAYESQLLLFEYFQDGRQRGSN